VTVESSPPQGPKKRALDAYVDKLADLRECAVQQKFWEEREKRIKAELAEVLGDATIGTVSGQDVVFYEYKDSFRGGDFAKAYPDMAKLYSRDIVKNQFDPKWLKVARPDLYEQFQTRAFRSTWDA